MIPDSIGPLSRPFPLHRVSPGGVEELVEATPEERATLRADLGLPAIHRLEGRFRVTGSADRFRVTGRVNAQVEQTCVVTLQAFPTSVEEDVDLEFQAPDPRRRGEPALDLDPDRDAPEELVGDRIDLGAITAEFLALGLDPYPRKPDAAFEPLPEVALRESPFARLASLRDDKGGG